MHCTEQKNLCVLSVLGAKNKLCSGCLVQAASLERKPSGRPPRSPAPPGLQPGQGTAFTPFEAPPSSAPPSPFAAGQSSAQTEIEAPIAQPDPSLEQGSAAESLPESVNWMAQPIIAPQMIKAGDAERSVNEIPFWQKHLTLSVYLSLAQLLWLQLQLPLIPTWMVGQCSGKMLDSGEPISETVC